MKKRRLDSDMPVGRIRRVRDFLPPPEELAIAQKNTKITIVLNRSSVDFFKRQAQCHHTKYQRMIRELLDRYAMQYSSG